VVDEATKLRRLGVPEDDLKAAQEMRRRQANLGAPVLSLSVICGITVPRRGAGASGGDPTQFRNRQLRGKSAGQQAALLTRVAALGLESPSAQLLGRRIATELDELFEAPVHQEFDFMRGNVTLAHHYQDIIEDRLTKSGSSPAQQSTALAILWTLTRFLAWQSYEVTIGASEIATRKCLDKVTVSKALKLLESIGAISQVKRGRRKVILITPEGAYRGSIDHHTETATKFRFEVIKGGRAKPDGEQIDIEDAIAATAATI
jgi:hypothetical protein